MADFRVPRAVAQFALIKPHLHAQGPQGVRYPLRRLGVLAGERKEYGSAGIFAYPCGWLATSLLPGVRDPFDQLAADAQLLCI